MNAEVRKRLGLIRGWFIVQELVTRECYELLGDNAILLFDLGALVSLVQLRKDLDCRAYVNTWYWGGHIDGRGYRDNYEATGGDGSTHRHGMAFDFVAERYTAEEVRQIILKNREKYPHIKRLERFVEWVHFDTLTKGCDEIVLFNA